MKVSQLTTGYLWMPAYFLIQSNLYRGYLARILIDFGRASLARQPTRAEICKTTAVHIIHGRGAHINFGQVRCKMLRTSSHYISHKLSLTRCFDGNIKNEFQREIGLVSSHKYSKVPSLE